MTSQQRQAVEALLIALTNISTPQQLEMIWDTVAASLRLAGITGVSKPTSVAQARALANNLKKRYID